MNLPSNLATMSSIEIAQLTGKRHSELLRAIRTMEPAWENISGRKFALADYIDAQGKPRPMFQLTKRECLYVATKFNDEARAKLVIRWEELENKNTADFNKLLAATTAIAESVNYAVTTLNNHSERLERLEKQQTTRPPQKSDNKFSPEIIDARNMEFDFTKINGTPVRRIIVNERANYSINDILQAIGVTTNSGQVARKLNKYAPHTVVKIHIFGNTHAAWFCTKKGIDLIKSGSRKLNGGNFNHDLN